MCNTLCMNAWLSPEEIYCHLHTWLGVSSYLSFMGSKVLLCRHHHDKLVVTHSTVDCFSGVQGGAVGTSLSCQSRFWQIEPRLCQIVEKKTFSFKLRLLVSSGRDLYLEALCTKIISWAGMLKIHLCPSHIGRWLQDANPPELHWQLQNW